MQNTNQNTVNQVKITFYNGTEKIYFRYAQKDGNFDVELCKDYLYKKIFGIFELQQRLKSIGAKQNFFGFSTSKLNNIDIELITENDVVCFTSGIQFKVSQLGENKKDAFNTIFDGYLLLNGNEVL
jgi:hypothetical protein